MKLKSFIITSYMVVGSWHCGPFSNRTGLNTVKLPHDVSFRWTHLQSSSHLIPCPPFAFVKTFVKDNPCIHLQHQWPKLFHAFPSWKDLEFLVVNDSIRKSFIKAYEARIKPLPSSLASYDKVQTDYHEAIQELYSTILEEYREFPHAVSEHEGTNSFYISACIASLQKPPLWFLFSTLVASYLNDKESHKNKDRAKAFFDFSQLGQPFLDKNQNTCSNECEKCSVCYNCNSLCPYGFYSLDNVD